MRHALTQHLLQTLIMARTLRGQDDNEQLGLQFGGTVSLQELLYRRRKNKNGHVTVNLRSVLLEQFKLTIGHVQSLTKLLGNIFSLEIQKLTVSSRLRQL